MSLRCLRALAASTLLAQTCLLHAQDGIDLVAEPGHRWHVSAYVPRVGPQVRCLRSDAEATQFCEAAWGEQKEALHIDFERDQILVLAWGPLRWAEGSAGAQIRMLLERATIEDGTLHVTVRTVLPPGPGIDIAADAPGRTWYPSLFVRTERTERVVVDLVGARRHAPAPDFVPVTADGLELRVAPDASPLRERMALVPPQETKADDAPRAVVLDRGDETVLELTWGELGPGAYHLDLVGMRIERGVARLTVRAENVPIVVYSGPGVHRPGLAVAMPRVDKVLLHIERTGAALPAGCADFETGTGERLVVTVDRALVRQKR